jgi:hypothetical protein
MVVEKIRPFMQYCMINGSAGIPSPKMKANDPEDDEV